MTLPLRAACLAALLLTTGGAAEAFEGNVNVFAGQKWLVEGDWAPIEVQPELGILLAFGETRAPIHFAIDVFYSTDDAVTDLPGIGSTRVEGSTTEYCIGIRKVFRRNAIMHPHLGGGASLLTGEVEVKIPVATSQADDTTFGYWIDGGITWRLASHLNLGVEVRYSRATLEFGNIFLESKVAGGGFHAGALVGYGW